MVASLGERGEQFIIRLQALQTMSKQPKLRMRRGHEEGYQKYPSEIELSSDASPDVALGGGALNS